MHFIIPLYEFHFEPKFRIHRITGLEIVRGGDQNFTHIHTPRPIL